MAKEQKVFGAEAKDAPKKTEEKVQDEGVQEITATSGEELLEQLIADSKKKSSTKKKKKIEEYKAVMATKEKLFSRLGETIDVPIIISDDELMVFKVKRLSEAENSEILDRSLAIKDVQDMTEEELEESNNYNYRLLEKVVVEPHLTQEEWRLNVDTAMVQRIVQKVMQVLTNIDDSRIFDEFQR
ncbi:hypothetical protein [Methanobrevibacter ruminantium]|uniref:hypothetical protein n=1 Tax=Methanobrevibacter ruminantium TaxID=83816 RepID=UPI0026F150D6|nr:hypothetical protein [Methanobrevibacter ruminantium]